LINFNVPVLKEGSFVPNLLCGLCASAASAFAFIYRKTISALAAQELPMNSYPIRRAMVNCGALKCGQ
jgi:hypothetical protein